MKEDRNWVKCLLCGELLRVINTAHLKQHGVSVQGYQDRFPKAAMQCIDQVQRQIAWQARRAKGGVQCGGK